MSPGASSESQDSGDDASRAFPQETSNCHGVPKATFIQSALPLTGYTHQGMVDQDFGSKDIVTPVDPFFQDNGVSPGSGEKNARYFGRTFSGLNDTTTNDFDGEPFDFTVNNSDYPLWPLTSERASN